MSETALRSTADYLETPKPIIDPRRRRVARTESADIAADLDTVRAVVERSPLEGLIQAHGRSPGVRGTTMVTTGPDDEAGARRIVHLTDGTHAVEEILVAETNGARRVFRYVVWNYSSPAAAVIDHAIGEFDYIGAGSATRLNWTYAFVLKRRSLPGRLGPIGRRLFRRGFLDGPYAALINRTMSRIKELSEAQASS